MDRIYKDRIRRWVKALRSGKYKQSRNAMHGTRGHCCLGVARCLIKGEIIVPNTDNPSNYSRVRTYYNIEDIQPLVDLNDSNHRSFGYIASWIEKKFLNADS